MIFDFDIDFLREAVALVDASLERLDRETKVSPDPDAFGVFDRLEYITGFGFVACQTYITVVASRNKKKLEKCDALSLGPRHRTGRTMVELTNAAANHWKHSSEWSLNAPRWQAMQTIKLLTSLGLDTTPGSYPVANALYHILTPHRPRFASLIPFLMQWRDELRDH